MLSIKHALPKALAPLSPIQLVSRRCNVTANTPSQSDEKTSPQFDGILNVLGRNSNEAAQDDDASKKKLSAKTKSPAGSNLFNIDVISSLTSVGQPPNQLHINASPNNTILTLTRPNGAPLVTTSGGSAGFKKAARSGYEAAHQAALQLLDKMNAKNLQVTNLHIVLKGFGPGRDAAFKALVGGAQWNVKRITDATPVPFGGCRPKKARRL
jgi:ribosomal protein S11